MHINAKLGAAADAVYLIAADGETLADSFSWGDSISLGTADVSIGRNPDGGDSWQLFGTGQPSPASPGFSNLPVHNQDNNAVSGLSALKIYPNPGRGNICFQLKSGSAPAKLEIYNLKGQLVKNLILSPGQNTSWDSTDNHGRSVCAGLYLCRTTSGKQHQTRKLVLIK